MNTIHHKLALGFFILISLATQLATATPADSLVIRFANRTRLVVYAPDKAGIQALSKYDLNKIVREMGMQLDSVPGGQTAISRDGEPYLRDTVLVVRKKKNGVTIVINGSGDTTKASSDKNSRDYKKVTIQRNNGRSWAKGFDIQLGLNTWLTQTVTPGYSGAQTDLSPLGSRYFALAFSQRPTLIDGKRAKLSLYYAIEGSWNNYMFDNNVVATKGPTQVDFTPYPETLKKSKLTTFALQVPVVPRLSFYNASGRKTFHIGIGGFAGYRLDSYTKIKRANDDKYRDHNNLYLNNFRYGLVGHIGILKTNLFVKYDLNPVFQTGKGPDMRTLSFGIVL